MRNATLCAMVLLAGLFPAAAGDDPKKTMLLPDTLKVGQVGQFNAGIGEKKDRWFKFKVVEIVSDNEMIVRVGVTPVVYVKGQSTKDLADEATIELRGIWKITGTKKHRSRTYFLAEPFVAKK